MPPRTGTSTATGGVTSPRAVNASAVLSVPSVAFLVTVMVRLVAAVCAPELEAYAGIDQWVAHPTTASLVSPLPRAVVDGAAQPLAVRLLRRSTTQGLFFSSSDREEIAPSFPLRFSATVPPLEAAVWRDIVFLREHHRTASPAAGRDDADDGGLPDYLTSLAPWYAAWIPRVLARQPWTLLTLSLMDGFTAALFLAYFPSASVQLVYCLFVVNPFTVAACVLESLQPLEWLALTVIVEACRRARIRGGCRVAYASFAVAIALSLGSVYLAVVAVLLFPMGACSRRWTMLSAGLLSVAVGVYALVFMFLDTHERVTGPAGRGAAGSGLSTLASALGFEGYTKRPELSTLYAPVDNGVLWYVRQVVLPAFEECLSVLLMELPALIIIPLCVTMPDVRVYVEADRAERTAGPAIEPLFADTKVFMLIFAVLLSFLFRSYFNLAYVSYGVMLIYAHVNPRASDTVLKSDPAAAPVVPAVDSAHGCPPTQTVRVPRAAYQRARVIIPLYTFIIFASAQFGLYVAYCLYEAANANWLFFSGVAVTLAAAFFLAAWMEAIVEDVTSVERRVEGW